MSASGFKMGCFPDLDPSVWPGEQARPLPNLITPRSLEDLLMGPENHKQ